MQHAPRPRSASAANGTTHGEPRHQGLKIERRYTKAGVDPLEAVTYERRTSAIANTDGSTVFKMENAEVPKPWSQLATDIVVSKYFRKAGVPLPAGQAWGTGTETSVRQVVHRSAHAIRKAGEEFGGYFRTPEAADAFESELA